jgi:peptidoglycan-associated lipoprotein
MNLKVSMYISFVLLLGLVSMYGCPKKTGMESSPEAQRENVTAPATPATPSTGTEETNREASSGRLNERSSTSAKGLRPVYFDFDKAIIRDDAKAIMKANAGWLKANPKTKITIEGNCDERGTIEYNQALGQRRAVSAKQYLVALGVSGSRISLISYGKEKPVCAEHDEACWEKNRKDDFVVK